MYAKNCFNFSLFFHDLFSCGGLVSKKKQKIRKEAGLRVTSVPGPAEPLSMYLNQISRFPLLSVEEEQRLARRYRDHQDLKARDLLLVSNLRFVTKIAFEYRSYGLSVLDLIQEGNIGFMRAVEKFDPDRHIRLISYGVWWVRAYIQNYVMDHWTLVKLGTTQAQRKLFFALRRTQRELEKLNGYDGSGNDAVKIAKELKVKPTAVMEMLQRMSGHDRSLSMPVGEKGVETQMDLVPSAEANPEEEIGKDEEDGMIRARIRQALDMLDGREYFIVMRRVMMEDKSMTLVEVGKHLGLSRERARQIETRALEKLASLLGDLCPEPKDWPRL